MEHLGAVSGSNQTAFEESDVMAQLLGDYSFSGEHDHELMNLGMQPMFWPDDDHELNLYSYFWSQESCLVSDDNVALSAHQFEEQSKSFNVKRKFDTATTTTTTMIEEIPSENYKKKPRVATKEVQRNAKTIQTKKRESNAAAMNGLNAGYCSSEDDSNASTQELHASSGSKGNAAVNTNTQVRATRGSATDPQSLYARKRRERINERLRTLQNLVPNGTKVDISTMLEEAVQYVKFMQLQIKLLSSDELWMYAPIAYNGVNIGLDLNISPPKQ